ncbi:thioesterase II family protein [Mycolicibacterium fortuitum]|uniref:Thioesterase TesA n=1 Tax=Mycolicibacterium fortuitum subsp. fortuitum DSM 46621 = ATCC 6841 = JCM 6387 TaxID=1214102 RepID=K0VB27_MYCFO|nr:alpha/beta fold hydrolase [Mycolicibacterium fortuitum]CRL77827.1 thioesterase [Mycolicibacter nonchromogenicus]EJZ16317.1 thioesterase [Mycolicibacterium fortuitum subsp. fortuitum DSM 46621 = ATCC 6841 = JCM 6387]OBG45909.1 thioesterase [Mycolicibacterium fortuitum]WEV30852.1 thioesterase domain-containing protein [Mycolicibacterium fortuitum]CRL56148.1 thioesterase [Mycolicibacterium fortuitum subsp. fortuitum DSM 46621 = ATCC 6841 = JCM 6387]
MTGPDTQITVKPWVKRYPGAESTSATLVFPHAGGAAVAYRGFGMALAAAGTDAYVMQYPQRGDRLSHPAPPTVGDLAKDLFEAGDWAGIGSLRLFGHCMGAVVAFEFARIAERSGIAIDAVWVSASEAPSAVAAAPALPMAESEILAEMVDLGGTDEALLADEDFVELLLMAVRADYAAFNRYACDADVTIAADIYALGGDRDHRISEDMLRRWETHTTGAYTCSMFDGGHFYLNSQLEDVAELVNEL